MYKGVHETDYRTLYKENFDHPKKQATTFTGDTNPVLNRNQYQTDINLHSRIVAPDPDKVNPIDRIPVVGYQGFNPVYMNPLRNYKKLEEMKKRFDEGLIPQPQENKVKHLAELEVPCVGYTGFIKGKKAENVYGKAFQRTAMESMIKEKNAENSN